MTTQIIFSTFFLSHSMASSPKATLCYVTSEFCFTKTDLSGLSRNLCSSTVVVVAKERQTGILAQNALFVFSVTALSHTYLESVESAN